MEDIPVGALSIAEMLEDIMGEALILLEAGPGGEDAEVTKFSCCNKDTS